VLKNGSYSIGEAADMVGASVPTLRMYEREGLIIPEKLISGHRRYTEQDVERIRCMRKTIRGEKIGIAGIRRILALIPCWRIKGCPAGERNACPAFVFHEDPCWMASEKSWECKNADCRQCLVYTACTDCGTLKETIVAFTTGGTPAFMQCSDAGVL